MKVTDTKALEEKILSHHVPGCMSDTVETGDTLKSSLAFGCPPATAVNCCDLMDYLDFLSCFLEHLTFNVMGLFSIPQPTSCQCSTVIRFGTCLPSPVRCQTELSSVQTCCVTE